ncbi:hypothetical protein LEP1GSC038_2317 [Leptospira weilii str. 2006001855]|uniref:Uncharacterized protein n=1 Tax=Leptospira weilii str. 2006001855 TaxID=996804 RepID=M6FWJ8_9LEPT|nr:hypothetical protein LEP1GSC038_2317 [Leptospira weilii str. 2006001855]EMN42670.1 hypothetical protein LEP1GSC086_1431 [Leptospira weilii str. LNT 1234]OMI18186.1 hypothetical protein BUQ74_06345 [Leptospira weilii serovar Heyan]QDK22335.1 hypothetical protein FHG67_06020 [Leptospira weilii]QDK26277.1 hypothetical protein FHG68_05935 [Leptospira weilii]
MVGWIETDFNLCSISVGVRHTFLANNASILLKIPFREPSSHKTSAKYLFAQFYSYFVKHKFQKCGILPGNSFLRLKADLS